MKKFLFDIDIVGSCNLRCPSCPQGNSRNFRAPHGFMTPELLERIVEKAKSECRVASISLFSWGEPLLHPDLPAMIRVVNAAGVPCHLSSNLNLRHDPDAIMAANPASFKVSVSGFTQETYGRTHCGGDIERVKEHLIALAAAKVRQHATTRIFVNYHRYRHNFRDEVQMRAFAEGLGIDFEPVWALFFPLEKIIGFLAEEGEGLLSVEERQLIDSLALPLGKALEQAEQCELQSCSLQETEISMDHHGNVQLCCGIFDSSRFTIGNYLALSLSEIQRMRQSHPMCAHCLRQGAHLYLTYRLPAMDEMVLARLAPEEEAIIGLRSELARKRRQERRSRIFNKLFARFLTAEQKTLLVEGVYRLQHVYSRKLQQNRKRLSRS